MRTSRGPAAPLCVALSISAAVAACATAPGGGRPSFANEEEERKAGESAFGPAVEEALGRAGDARLQAFVGSVGRKLASASPRPGLPWEFVVVNAGYDLSFVLPGGEAAVSRGLLARLYTEDQLAALLAHEVAHVVARHTARAWGQARPLAGALGSGSLAAAVEGTGPRALERLAALAGAGQRLVPLRYTPAEEREADEIGLDLLVKAGYAPDGLAGLLEILEKARAAEPERVAPLLASHPLRSGRTATARRRAEAADASERARPATADEFARRTRRLKAEAPAFEVAFEAEAALVVNDPRKAAVKYAEAARLAPLQAVLPALQATALLAAGEDEGGRGAAAGALAVDPDLVLARLAAGLAAFRLGSFREAIDQLTAAEAAAGGARPPSSYLIGLAHERLGEAAKAAERYRLVVAGRGEDTADATRRLEGLSAAASVPAP
ncbi:MAG: hypothetical protein EDX89_00545 [Acidobacteria bacterium]|nr:MAG: hypothetical protein EDX89_00545 [Acidobacteriota bacterium]